MTDRQIRIIITLISLFIVGCFMTTKSYAGLQFALPSKFMTKNSLTYPKKVTEPEDPVIVIPDVGKAMILNKSHKPKTQTLYVISAKSGHFENGKLTLSNTPLVSHFPREMDAKTSALLPIQFVTHWQNLVTGEAKTSPTATLAIYTRTGTNNITLALSKPTFINNQIAFNAKVLTGDLPMDFKLSTLFIGTDIDTQPTVSAFETTMDEPAIEAVAEETPKLSMETSPNTLTNKYKQVYVLTSKNGHYKDGKLILENIPTALIYEKGHYATEPLQAFISNSGIATGGSTMGSLILYSQTSANRVLVSFSNMTLENNTLHFDANILKGNLPESFKLSTVFFTMP